MQTFKDSITFYFKNIHYLLLISLTIVLPVLVFAIFLINYIYYLYDGTSHVLFGDIANGYLLFIFLVLLQLPFARFVYCDLEGIEAKMRESYLTFLIHGFSVFIFAIIFVTVVFVGSLMLIAPGIFLLVCLYLMPYITAFQNQATKSSLREAFYLGKKHFFLLLLLILVTGLLQIGMNIVGSVGISMFTSKYSAVFSIQILMNLLILPFTAVLISMFTLKWKSEV
ncbi:hypothetical protein ACNQFZ_09785 [Schinkia sp. CFF1]